MHLKKLPANLKLKSNITQKACRDFNTTGFAKNFIDFQTEKVFRKRNLNLTTKTIVIYYPHLLILSRDYQLTEH